MFLEELFCGPKAPTIPASNLVYKSRKHTDFETFYSIPLSASSRDSTSWKIVSRQDGSGFNTRCPFAAGQEQSLGSTKRNQLEGALYLSSEPAYSFLGLDLVGKHVIVGREGE